MIDAIRGVSSKPMPTVPLLLPECGMCGSVLACFYSPCMYCMPLETARDLLSNLDHGAMPGSSIRQEAESGVRNPDLIYRAPQGQENRT